MLFHGPNAVRRNPDFVKSHGYVYSSQLPFHFEPFRFKLCDLLADPREICVDDTDRAGKPSAFFDKPMQGGWSTPGHT